MTTICWTVLHHAGVSVSHGARHTAHAVGHVVRPIIHHAGGTLRHAPMVAARPRTWITVVCKVIPVVLAGGGLVAPHPLNPPSLPVAPPAIVAPGPVFSPWLPPTWFAPPGPPPNPEAAPEPSSAILLLGGVAALALFRLTIHRVEDSSGRIQPTPSQTKLLGSGPVS